MKQRTMYFANIELIRFVCAFLIIIFHAFYGWKDNFGYPKFLLNNEGQLSSFGALFDNAIHNLSLGVDVFFLISGFVITHILLNEKMKKGRIDLKKYFLSRAFRILPLFYVALALTPLYNYYFQGGEPNYIRFIFGLGNFEIIENGWGTATVNSLWTLCIEMQFYVVWPFLIAFVSKQRLYQLFIFIIFISFFYRALIFHTDNWWMNVYMHSLSRMDVIAIGSIIATWYHSSDKIEINVSRVIRLMIYLIFIYVYLHDDAGNMDSIFLVTVKKYFYVGIITFAFVNYLFNPTAMFVISERNPLQKLGKITYGLYIFNIVVVSFVIDLYLKKGFESIILFYALIVFISITVAVFSYFLIEKPFIFMKNKLVQRMKKIEA